MLVSEGSELVVQAEWQCSQLRNLRDTLAYRAEHPSSASQSHQDLGSPVNPESTSWSATSLTSSTATRPSPERFDGFSAESHNPRSSSDASRRLPGWSSPNARAYSPRQPVASDLSLSGSPVGRPTAPLLSKQAGGSHQQAASLGKALSQRQEAQPSRPLVDHPRQAMPDVGGDAYLAQLLFDNEPSELQLGPERQESRDPSNAMVDYSSQYAQPHQSTAVHSPQVDSVLHTWQTFHHYPRPLGIC